VALHFRKTSGSIQQYQWLTRRIEAVTVEDQSEA
jgi:hypothetical protein